MKRQKNPHKSVHRRKGYIERIASTQEELKGSISRGVVTSGGDRWTRSPRWIRLKINAKFQHQKDDFWRAFKQMNDLCRRKFGTRETYHAHICCEYYILLQRGKNAVNRKRGLSVAELTREKEAELVKFHDETARACPPADSDSKFWEVDSTFGKGLDNCILGV